MTDLAYTIPASRRERIELAAAILFGRKPGSLTEPADGWIPRLARAMGVGDSTVRSTLELDRPSTKFDKRLAELLIERRRMMRNVDMPTLGDLAQIFEGGWGTD